MVSELHCAESEVGVNIMAGGCGGGQLLAHGIPEAEVEEEARNKTESPMSPPTRDPFPPTMFLLPTVSTSSQLSIQIINPPNEVIIQLLPRISTSGHRCPGDPVFNT